MRFKMAAIKLLFKSISMKLMKNNTQVPIFDEFKINNTSLNKINLRRLSF